jgi:tRNA modification GTPase
MGIARAREALAGADVAVLLVPPEARPEEVAAWRAEAPDAVRLEVNSKADLLNPSQEAPSSRDGVRVADAASAARPPVDRQPSGETDEHQRAGAAGEAGSGPLRVSGETGLGVAALQAALVARLGGGVAGAVRVTSERHLDALRRAAEALERAEVAVTASTLEVVSGEVGLALAALADITGEDVSSELLDAIFARFCIGK